MGYRLNSKLPVIGMFILTSVFIGMVVLGADQKVVQQLPSSLENLADAKLVEIRDESGGVIVSGSFVVSTEKDGDIEGVANLVTSGTNVGAKGKAEFEVSKKSDGTVKKELEIELKKLTPATNFNLFVDGQQISSLRTNARGSAELEFSTHPTK